MNRIPFVQNLKDRLIRALDGYAADDFASVDHRRQSAENSLADARHDNEVLSGALARAWEQRDEAERHISDLHAIRDAENAPDVSNPAYDLTEDQQWASQDGILNDDPEDPSLRHYEAISDGLGGFDR